MLFKPGEFIFGGMEVLSISSPRRVKCILAVKSPSSSHLLVQHWMLVRLSCQGYNSPTLSESTKVKRWWFHSGLGNS